MIYGYEDILDFAQYQIDEIFFFFTVILCTQLAYHVNHFQGLENVPVNFTNIFFSIMTSASSSS